MGAITRYIAKQYLRQSSIRHRTLYPQVACFAFDVISTWIFIDGRYEASQLDFLREKVFPRLDRSAACLDIGANIGNHSLDFARSFARVYAFEPNPRSFHLLSYNASLADNIQALNFGLSDAPGQLKAEQVAGNIGASHITGNATPRTGKTVTFEVKRLDDVPEILAADRIAFVKIDVEGHEMQCLSGAEVTLRKHKPVVVLEVLAEEVENGKSTAVEFLRSIGYAHVYDLATPGTNGRFGRTLNKIGRLLSGLFLNRPAGRHLELIETTTLAARNHPMVVCSAEPLVG